MVYQWAYGYRLSGDAQKVGEELEGVRKRAGGKLHARDVVAAAVSERSPLHRLIEWDESKAAREYRLTQARTIIRALVTVTTADEPTRPAYVNVVRGGDKAGSYVPMHVVLRSPKLADQIDTKARKELEGWLTRYAEHEPMVKAAAFVRRAVAMLTKDSEEKAA